MKVRTKVEVEECRCNFLRVPRCRHCSGKCTTPPPDTLCRGVKVDACNNKEECGEKGERKEVFSQVHGYSVP